MNYISLTEAAARCDYSQEYLSLRARQGKLKAAKQGRNWVTTHAWLMDYLRQVDVARREMQDPAASVASPHQTKTDNEVTTQPKVTKIPVASAAAALSVVDRVGSFVADKLPVESFERSKKVWDEMSFRPTIPHAWLNDNEQNHASMRRSVDFNTAHLEPHHADFWELGHQAAAPLLAETSTEPSTAMAPVEEIEINPEPIEEQEPEPVTPIAMAVEPEEEAEPMTSDTLTGSVSAESTEIETGVEEDKALAFSLHWLRPVATAAFALLLVIEVGILLKPIAASGIAGDVATKVAVGAAVLTGDSPALTWDEGSTKPRLTDENYASTLQQDQDNQTTGQGQVAGATVELDQKNEPTALQKVAAGLLVTLDEPYDGVVTPVGSWIAETFDVPIE